MQKILPLAKRRGEDQIQLIGDGMNETPHRNRGRRRKEVDPISTRRKKDA